ncbi:MAG: ParA family protein [Rhodospirillales bacterium]|nr:ParA family protein [Rhodospirillales bacterium]
MSAHVMTVAQQKGGSGKTTLAAQIAAAWSAEGQRTALVDIDPQASLATWFQRRTEWDGAPVHTLHLSKIAGWRIAAEIDRLRRDFDAVIVDSPPHAETETRTAVRAADLVLIPVQPSPMDIWATQPTLEMARKEKVRALIVLNRVPARARLIEAVEAALAKESVPVATCRLGNRTAFAQSMMEGRAVVECAPRSTAAAEVRALADELRRLFS